MKRLDAAADLLVRRNNHRFQVDAYKQLRSIYVAEIAAHTKTNLRSQGQKRTRMNHALCCISEQRMATRAMYEAQKRVAARPFGQNHWVAAKQFEADRFQRARQKKNLQNLSGPIQTWPLRVAAWGSTAFTEHNGQVYIAGYGICHDLVVLLPVPPQAALTPCMFHTCAIPLIITVRRRRLRRSGRDRP
jgi:hypothetical protein